MSALGRRLQQRALSELRKQASMLVEDTDVAAPGSTGPRADTSTHHDPTCRMAESGRLDFGCRRCQAILTIAGS